MSQSDLLPFRRYVAPLANHLRLLAWKTASSWEEVYRLTSELPKRLQPQSSALPGGGGEAKLWRGPSVQASSAPCGSVAHASPYFGLPGDACVPLVTQPVLFTPSLPSLFSYLSRRRRRRLRSWFHASSSTAASHLSHLSLRFQRRLLADCLHLYLYIYIVALSSPLPRPLLRIALWQLSLFLRLSFVFIFFRPPPTPSSRCACVCGVLEDAQKRGAARLSLFTGVRRTVKHKQQPSLRVCAMRQCLVNLRSRSSLFLLSCARHARPTLRGAGCLKAFPLLFGCVVESAAAVTAATVAPATKLHVSRHSLSASIALSSVSCVTRSPGSHLFCTFHFGACACSSSALHISRMPVSTLHPGVLASDSGGRASPPPQPPQHARSRVVAHNLGEDGCAGEGTTSATAGVSKRRHRSFKDAMEVVVRMTGRRPNRCPDGFETTKRFIDRLGFAPILERIRFVHVAGTKGKGTTSAYTAALLQAYGFKVGLFTSPHLTDLRERTVVDGRLLDENTYAQYFFEFLDKYEALQYSDSQLDRDIASPSRANFFRFIFLLSLYIFEQEGVEVAVMEAGIGGRIDSTNTIPSEVSIITSLGYDHMEILGNTIQEIASEKAGIMKPGVVCFAAPQVDHPETRPVLEKHARKIGTPLVLLDRNMLPIHSWPKLAIGGVHAIEDSKLALMAARRIANIPPILPLDEVEKSVLQSMTYAGRSQIAAVDDGANITFYLDGAHTVESISSATQWFLDVSAAHTRDPAPRRVLVFYTSRDPKRVLKAFMPYVPHFCKVIIAQVSNPRMTSHSADPSDADGRVSELREKMVATTEHWRNMYREVTCLPCARSFSALEDILDLVLPAASDNEDASKPAQVFVCGSFFLVGDVMRLLKVYEAGGRRPE